MEIRRDVFQAIADPTRRAILALVALQAMTPGAIAENFDISRPAISQHIKVLTECGLVEITQQGRDRYCNIQFQKLAEVSKWVEQYRIFWTSKLDALETHLSKDTKSK